MNIAKYTRLVMFVIQADDQCDRSITLSGKIKRTVYVDGKGTNQTKRSVQVWNNVPYVNYVLHHQYYNSNTEWQLNKR